MHHPKTICKCHIFNVSEGKANTMAFRRKHTTGTKIVTDGYSLQKGSHFKYPG
jgi:hypothetical protein